MTHSDHLLRQILARIQKRQAQGDSCLAVFDLDSTLFDVSPRVQRILEEFSVEPAHQEQFPKEVTLFKNIRTTRADWGFREALQRVGLDRSSPEFLEALRAYWKQRFFSNEYLEFDLPYEGAVEYVNHVANLGAEVVYLTGRDTARMGSGSALVLKKWGFPLDDLQTRLELKPHMDQDDAEFKTEWFQNLPSGKFSDIWFFENEPVNIHHLRRHAPEIEIIFFDSTHAGRAEAPEDLPRILHFLTGESGKL